MPDFADGYASGGTGGNAGPDAAANFTPLYVMPIGFSSGDTITFWYDGSDPADVSVSGDPQRGYVYTPAAGGLRIWTRNGGWGYVDEYEVAHGRDSRGLEDGGDYVTPGYVYTIADFAPFADEYGRITLYVEGVNGSGQLGDYTVSVVAEHGTYTYDDALRFPVVDAELTAYRAGARFGQALPDSIEGMSEANRFYVQINNEVVSLLPDGRRVMVADVDLAWGLLLWASEIDPIAPMNQYMNDLNANALADLPVWVSNVVDVVNPQVPLRQYNLTTVAEQLGKIRSAVARLLGATDYKEPGATGWIPKSPGGPIAI